MSVVQTPSVILPVTGLVETVNDVVCHNSLEVMVDSLEHKMVQITATEVVVAGVPGALWCWIELSPFPSVNNALWSAPLAATALYWGAIGGGGGAYYQLTGVLPPIAPHIEAPLGVTGTVHTIQLPWTTHSYWVRLVVQAPGALAPATAYWSVQAVLSGGSK